MPEPRYVALVLVALLAGGCASSGAVPRPFPGASTPAGQPSEPPPGIAGASPVSEPGARALATALEQRGIPYRNGGSDPSGFDCSGLVQWVFAQNGRALPREVREQYLVGQEVEADEVRAGDLLFFDTSSGGASHVGIALDRESFVHAPSSNGVVRVERYTSSYWSRRYLGARRVE
ncbi:MAG TPA: C40 family peptidase [Vicinamibacterales bacterium]|nr:C40 family peptidase [Vicinamibacterales bacterium]